MAEEVADILRQDGIEVLLEARTLGVERSREGEIRLTVKTPQGERTVAGTQLLVATGRVPNTEGLGLEAAGVKDH